jgi:hypothetical protein
VILSAKMVTGPNKKMTRIWRWEPLTIRKIFGGALICIVVAVLIVMGVLGPFFRQSANYGFGPEWNCQTPDGSVAHLNCIKRTP